MDLAQKLPFSKPQEESWELVNLAMMSQKCFLRKFHVSWDLKEEKGPDMEISREKALEAVETKRANVGQFYYLQVV